MKFGGLLSARRISVDRDRRRSAYGRLHELKLESVCHSAMMTGRLLFGMSAGAPGREEVRVVEGFGGTPSTKKSLLALDASTNLYQSGAREREL